MCVLRMVIYFDKFDSSFQGTWTTYGNLTTSFTLCTAWRDCATSRSRPVWICLFCVRSFIKSWISCYIIYRSQILNKSALYVDFNYSWQGKIVDKDYYSAKHRQFPGVFCALYTELMSKALNVMHALTL